MSSASSAAPNPDAAFTPAQILQALMVSCIYPLLQNKRTGPIDPAMAHAAAIEMLKSFHIRDTWELFIYTQAITFGLAALDSLGLSMTPDLSPAMVLRCRGTANNLQRTAQLSRRALDEHRAAAEARRAREAELAQVPDLADAQAEAASQIAETERLLAAARARAHGPASDAPAYAAPTTVAASNARADARPVPSAAAAHSIPAASLGMPAAAAPLANGYRAEILSSTASCVAAPPHAGGFLPPMSPPLEGPRLP
jgi:hypothetical protein